MSDTGGTGSSGGIGFIGLLTCLFIGLKLTHYIDWEWLWVLSPIWICAAVVAVIVVGVALIMVAGKLLWGRRSKR